MSSADDGTSFSENESIAISLYNKALQKIEAGNDDLARLDLKRAISLYPEFSTAIILLGVCVFCNGDRIGALRVFNSVKDEKYRVEAMDYLDKLAQRTDRNIYTKSKRKPVADKPEIKEKIHEVLDTKKIVVDDKKVIVESKKIEIDTKKIILDTKNILLSTDKVSQGTGKIVIDVSKAIEESAIYVDSEYEERPLKFERVSLDLHERENKPRNVHKKVELHFTPKIQKTLMVSAVLVLLFIVGLLIVNTNLSSKISEYKTLLGGTDGDGPSIAVDGNVSKNLETELADIKVRIAVIEAERDQYKLMADFSSAQVKYDSKNYKDVVDIISAMDRTKLNDEQKGVMQTIYDDSLNKFSMEGLYKLFEYRKSENYSEIINVALPIYEKNPSFTRAPEIIFYMALAYEKTNSLENASKYYKILIEKYPNSDQTRLAKSMAINQ